MVKVYIEGMMCNRCANHVKQALETIGENAEVSLDDNLATITTNASDQEIINVIENAGYEVTKIER